MRQYVAAWNERDAEVRLRVLDEIWAEGATYIESPGMADVSVVGRAAMSELIARNQGATGEWFEPRAWHEGYAHHDLLVMPWRHCTPDGPSGTIGTDYAELDPSGRIVLAVGFAPLTPDDSGMGDQPARVCAGSDTLNLSEVPPIVERYTSAWNAETSAERGAILSAISDEDAVRRFVGSVDTHRPRRDHRVHRPVEASGQLHGVQRVGRSRPPRRLVPHPLARLRPQR